MELMRVVIGIRPFTFFEKGVVGHVGFADPFDAKIGKVCYPPFPPTPFHSYLNYKHRSSVIAVIL